MANSKNGQISKFSILKKTMMINQGGVMLVIKMNTDNGPFKNGVRIFFSNVGTSQKKMSKIGLVQKNIGLRSVRIFLIRLLEGPI